MSFFFSYGLNDRAEESPVFFCFGRKRLFSYILAMKPLRLEEPAMIDILSLNGSGELLRKMTPAERGLFLLFGYASNQVNVLWKLVIVATNEAPEDPIQARVSAAQTQIIVRLVIGVLWEAWRLVQGRFLGSALGKEFVPKLDPAAKEALDRLKKEFGGSNMIATVRNEYCFHYPKPEEMENAFQRAMGSGQMEELDWGVYFSRKLLNVFFFVSDYVFAHGVSSAIAEGSVAETHQKLLMSLGPIANDLSEVAYGYTAAIIKKYLGPEMVLTVAAQVKDAPRIEHLRLPFYVETPDSLAALK